MIFLSNILYIFSPLFLQLLTSIQDHNAVFSFSWLGIVFWMSSSASDMIPPTTKNVKLGISKNKDRLSDLPDCVILHILSFLNAKHVVQTCVLSPRYKNLWKRISSLILDSSESDFRTLKIFTKFVSNVLSLRDSSILLQTLDFKGKHGHLEPRIIKNIVDYALSHKVQRLGLCFNGNTVQTLPSQTFNTS
jgi:hypothetical protein